MKKFLFAIIAMCMLSGCVKINVSISDDKEEETTEITTVQQTTDTSVHVPTKPVVNPIEKPQAVNNSVDETKNTNFNRAIASSQLGSQGSYSYYPQNVIDGNIRTAWVEGISGTGEGEWIEIQSNYIENIHKVCIVNGYRQDNATYAKNGKINSAELSFSDGSSQIVYFDTVDSDGYTCFNVGNKQTSFVRITLLSCSAGSKYEDTCISEVKIY